MTRWNSLIGRCILGRVGDHIWKKKIGLWLPKSKERHIYVIRPPAAQYHPRALRQVYNRNIKKKKKGRRDHLIGGLMHSTTHQHRIKREGFIIGTTTARDYQKAQKALGGNLQSICMRSFRRTWRCLPGNHLRLDKG